MVRTTIAICLRASLLLTPLAHAVDLTPSAAVAPSLPAATAMPALSSPTAATSLSAPFSKDIEQPPRPPKTQGHPFEDVVVVTLVSLPFTAFWSVIGALVIGGAIQHQFPPEIDDALLTGIAGATAISSLGIGLVSAQWGPGKAHP